MDLISREAAIEVIDELVSTMSVCVSTDECRGMNWMKRRAIAAIEALPTIDPVKRGRWEKTYLDHEAIGERPSIFYCSVCNQCIAYPVNYCPSCGADMRGEEDENNNQI